MKRTYTAVAILIVVAIAEMYLKTQVTVMPRAPKGRDTITYNKTITNINNQQLNAVIPKAFNSAI